MFRWQRHLHSIFRIGSNLKHTYENGSSFSIAHASAYPFYGLYNAQQRVLNASFEAITQPYFSYIQHLGISNSTKLLKESSDSSLSPVSSPLIPVSVSATDQTDSQTVITKPSKVQAVLKGIRQSSKKVNLVAALVRGMRVEDALLQLQLTVKRAAKTVYQVIHSARANAVHNHGLDPDRLLVAEAFLGKGTCLKRVSYHARGRSGVMVRPYCRLTVVVRETTPEEEAEIARLRVSKFRKLTKREHRLVPHKLIETTPRWGRKTIKSARTEIDA